MTQIARGKEGEARQHHVEQQQRRRQRRGFSAPLPVVMAICLISFGIGHKHGIASNMIMDDDDSRLWLIQPSSRSATSASTIKNTQTQQNYGLHPNIRNGHIRMVQLSENSSFLVGVPGDTDPEGDGTNDYTRQQVGYVRQDVIYGHIHLAKTGGTSLNGILANRYERICGHKGYSYDAYQSNELAKAKAKEDNVTTISIYYNKGFDIVDHELIQEIGFEDCDYVSEEMDSDFFVSNFGSNKFHNISMELHVPCRDPIDHLMSQCNFFREFLPSRKAGIYCNETNDNELQRAIMKCIFGQERFRANLIDHFPKIKCYDYQRQFTTYLDYMSKRLQPRRLVSAPYIQRETNLPRNKTKECIWERPDLIEKTKAFLVKRYPYYGFCVKCMGSEDEITKNK